ncbi:unnamed protein product [Sphenostylis stenocarpa]|uniref:Uncharacterized protein n=1 Tax=Sphenostylis stenocarpa TaxID=92480 RepID=A0AA86S7A0_9FABA|nr:unnamed protein product [Sphenostylis stenocarpa]
MEPCILGKNGRAFHIFPGKPPLLNGTSRGGRRPNEYPRGPKDAWPEGQEKLFRLKESGGRAPPKRHEFRWHSGLSSIPFMHLPSRSQGATLVN